MLDWLHTLSLGVFQTYIWSLVQRLFVTDFFGTGETALSVCAILSCHRMTPLFQAWVKRQNKKGRNLTEIGNIDAKFFGKSDEMKLMLKGGETNAFLEFLVRDLLHGKWQKLGEDGHLVQQAGENLCSILDMIRQNPKRMPINLVQNFHTCAKGYLRLLPILGVLPKPKDHMLMEMAIHLTRVGSPQLYGCWVDEGLNRLLRDVAGGAHSTVHERRVLIEFPRAHDNARARMSSSSKKRRV